MSKRFLPAVGLVIAVMIQGCRSDCEVVCEQIDACYFAELDQRACVAACDAAAAEDAAQAQRTEDCAECMGGKACPEVLEQCLDVCSDVAGY